MSTSTRRTHDQALLEATEFRDLFEGCYERWEYGGSLRRHKDEVGDIDHVVIPKHGTVMGDGLFAESKEVSLLMERGDVLVSKGIISKHVYGATGFRWGMRQRGCNYKGFNHELCCADEGNWGMWLAIKTGNSDFSKKLVTGLLRQGRRNKDGRVWKCDSCPRIEPGVRCPQNCPECQGTGLKPVEVIRVPTEEAYFELCGLTYVPPEKRV